MGRGRRWIAVATMVAPVARVAVRRARRRQVARASDVTVDVDGRSVALPVAHGQVRVDGRPVGEADVRIDLGTSTLEAWSRVEPDVVPAVIDAVEQVATDAQVRRLAWVVPDPSAERDALATRGFEREGRASSPTRAAEEPHETWVRLID